MRTSVVLRVTSRLIMGKKSWWLFAGMLGAWCAKSFASPIAMNTAPQVDAGEEQTIHFGENAFLHATVEDDGLPDPPGRLDLLWVLESGPGEVVFGNPKATETSTCFSLAGDYDLAILADDGEFQSVDQVKIQVLPQNVAPRVEAGGFQTVVLSEKVRLDGAASDDHLPDPPGTFTVFWQMFEGPGDVTFMDPHVLQAVITFSKTGTYWFRLTIDDGELQSSDETYVQVLPGNEPPFVEAGPDQSGVVGQSLDLAGTVQDDNQPDPPGYLQIRWSQIEGPAVAHFNNEYSLETKVTFDQSGNYILQLSANDGELEEIDRLTISVESGIDEERGGGCGWQTQWAENPDLVVGYLLLAWMITRRNKKKKQRRML